MIILNLQNKIGFIMDNLVLFEEETENLFCKEFSEACLELKDTIANKNKKYTLKDLINQLQND